MDLKKSFQVLIRFFKFIGFTYMKYYLMIEMKY